MSLWLAQNILAKQPNHTTTYLSSAFQHHAEITQSHTFVALIRLSTTTHNLLTFNTAKYHQRTQKNSAYRQINTSGLFSYTHLIHVPGCTVTRLADQCTFCFTLEKILAHSSFAILLLTYSIDS